MRSKLLFGIAVLILAACSSTHSLRREGVAPKISKDARVFVCLPADGRFEKTTYAGSGEMTLQAVEVAFKRHVADVHHGSTIQTRDAALVQARTSDCSHLVIPEILHWEDRATEWSGKLDHIEVRLTLIEIANGTTLDKVTFSAKSKWVSFGGDHPQDLLPECIDEYVDSLF